jgi:dimethylhistidine N-methyltransferase
VPIDIAASSLGRAARAVQRDYPDLSVLPLCADFSRRIELPEALPSEAPRLVYFPGSTLGNYESVEARRLLLTMRGLAGAGGAALLGIDLVKDRALLEHAYNDSQGVTAEFNLNALRHVNRRLGLGFDVGRFRHRAQWVESAQRIEMHLLASAPQSVRMGAAVVRMQRGDYIRTECSHKFSLEGLGALAADAGWQARASWCDPQQWFAVVLLEPRAAAADSGGLTHSS